MPVAPGPIVLPSPPAPPGARVEPARARWQARHRDKDEVVSVLVATSSEPNKELLSTGEAPAAEFERSADKDNRKRWRSRTVAARPDQTEGALIVWSAGASG
ncbi:hypothetical protein LBMAG42_35530 [Deltaproteobacteria bacterium]|nr:hypothetical protein LBMAG42_35530 [Deltaproteobacteria bacterium]